MKFVHIAWDGAGNVVPQLALCERLVREGHDVVSVVDETLLTRFEAVGVRCIAASGEPRPPGLGGTEEMLDTFARYVFGRSWADDLLAAVERERPDRLLVDGMLWAAAAAAEATGLPTALLWHSLFTAIVESPLADLIQSNFHGHHAAIRAGLGLDAVPHVTDQLRRADWLLAFAYEPVDRPARGTWPNLRYVGAPVPTPAPASTNASSVAPVGDDPLVLVGFSTGDMGQLAVLQDALDALAALRVRTLVTCGPAVEIGDLQLPANAAAVAHVPHDDVLGETAVLVTHAGHGTLAAGVRHGVPMVAVPMGRDQHANAGVVQALGIGTVIDQRAVADQLAPAVETLLGDPCTRAAAAALAACVADHPGLDAAVDLVTGPVGG